MTPITLVDGYPELPASAEAWLDRLAGPTVIRLRGRDSTRTRLVSGMLHGNEPSGLFAIFHALASRAPLATDALFFVGAVEAARAEPRLTNRMLEGRRDLNRCFREPFSDVDGRIAGALLERLRAEPLEAVVDLHNTSGHNPPYGIAAGMDSGRIGVTSLFAARYVASSLSIGALGEAFPASVRAVAIECGRAGERRADETAIAGLTRFLAAGELPRVEGRAIGMHLYRDPVRVHVRRDVSLAFGDRGERHRADVTVDANVDRHNFQRLLPGTRIAWVRQGVPWPFDARTASGSDVSKDLFEWRDDGIVARRELVPIMMTTSAKAARDDCLCYIVEPVESFA